jgi:hypothetical protein
LEAECPADAGEAGADDQDIEVLRLRQAVSGSDVHFAGSHEFSSPTVLRWPQGLLNTGGRACPAPHLHLHSLQKIC